MKRIARQTTILIDGTGMKIETHFGRPYKGGVAWSNKALEAYRKVSEGTGWTIDEYFQEDGTYHQFKHCYKDGIEKEDTLI